MTEHIERKNLNDDTDAIKAHQLRDDLVTDVKESLVVNFTLN